MSWIIITDDPKTLPPVDVPVFAAGGSLNAPCILVLSEGADEKGAPVWVWCDLDGNPYWSKGKKQWTVWDSSWDDDYNPVMWHPFPNVFDCPMCGSVGGHHHADSTGERPILVCPQCGHTGEG